MSLNYKLEALYHFNGDVTDSSGNGNDGTNNNVSFVADKDGVANSAGSFDGSSSYVNMFNTISYKTYSFWFKSTTFNNKFTAFGYNYGSNSFVNFNTDGTIRVNLNGNQFTTSSTYNDGNWHFIAVNYETGSIYIDNKLVNTINSDVGLQTISRLYIGRLDNRDDFYFQGEIDEVRIYSRAITEFEITQLYYAYDTEKNQVGTLNYGLVFGSHFNSGTATDWTGNGNDGTVNGATATTDKNGNPDSSLSFDGVDDYASFSGSFTGENLSVTMSLKYTDSTTLMIPLKLRSSDGNNVLIVYLNNNGDLQVLGEDTGSNNLSGYFSNSSLYDGNFNTITFILDYNNNTIDFYFNKVKQTTTYIYQTATSGYSYTGTSYLGAEQDLTRRYYNGDMDEPRIYTRKLSHIEHLMLFKGYDSEQNSQDTFDIDLEAYYPFSGNANDESGNSNDGTVNGATLTLDKLGNNNSAYSFDGTNDEIQVADDNSLDFNDVNFSVLQFAKTNQNTDTRWTLSKKTNTGVGDEQTNYNVGLQQTSSNLFIQFGNGSSNDTINSNFSFGTTNFHQIGFAYDSSTSEVDFYFDSQKETQSVSVNPASNNYPLFIGSHYASNANFDGWDGIIDETRIYRRKITQDEAIEYTYSYDTPTMLDDDLVGDGVVTRNSLFSVGGI